jgi:excisionase family DNA binding protein
MQIENKRTVERLKGEVLTVEEVAEILQLSRSTIVRLFKHKTIPAKLIGNKWRCPRSVLDNFLHTA